VTFGNYQIADNLKLPYIYMTNPIYLSLYIPSCFLFEFHQALIYVWFQTRVACVFLKLLTCCATKIYNIFICPICGSVSLPCDCINYGRFKIIISNIVLFWSRCHVPCARLSTFYVYYG